MKSGIGISRIALARQPGYAELREFFQISRYYIAVAALKTLADEGGVPHSIVVEALRKYGVDPEKPSPAKT